MQWRKKCRHTDSSSKAKARCWRHSVVFSCMHAQLHSSILSGQHITIFAFAFAYEWLLDCNTTTLLHLVGARAHAYMSPEKASLAYTSTIYTYVHTNSRQYTRIYIYMYVNCIALSTLNCMWKQPSWRPLPQTLVD